MTAPLEGVVRPFADRNVSPTPFVRPGASGAQQVRVPIGFSGSLKTMGYSFSVTMSMKMGQSHNETAPNGSDSLQRRLAQAAGG